MKELQGVRDLNELIPEELRKKLNEQPDKMRNEAVYDANGKILEPYMYVLGLGEKHFKSFDREILRLTGQFPWTKKKQIRFIMNELVINTQFSMLRQVVRQVREGVKSAGYFNVQIYICNQFFSASIEEFGDFFDYYGYLEQLETLDYSDESIYDSVDETVINLSTLKENQVKLILTPENDLVLADIPNRIGLKVIEKATDQDFYVTSFYKEDKYMWKRVYFRVENDL